MNTEPASNPSFSQLTQFFAPLALQSASQGLTYPLVAIVASRGKGGPLNLAGLAQSNTLLFMLGTLGFGLVATGMVFGKTREGFNQFRSITLILAMVVVSIQAMVCIPVVAKFVFEQLIGLPSSIARPAHIALLASIPLQILFFLRIPYQVSMYNALASGRASLATIVRIILTAILAPIFCSHGAVGPVWAIVCLSLPVALEVGASALLARRFIQNLPPKNGSPISKKTLIKFNLPLSVSGYLLSFSAMLLSAFIARAADPERMLPAYYLALGLATPLAYGTTRLQEVVLTFHPRHEKAPQILAFAFCAGTVMGLLPLLFTLPGLAEFYFVRLQNLAPGDLIIVRITALGLVLFPLSVAIRAQGEGLAAFARKPLTIIAGQGAYFTTILLSGSITLWLGVPGNLIGPISLFFSNMTSTSMVRLILNKMKQQSPPIPPVTTSFGHIP